MRSCIAIPCTVLTAVIVCACGSKAPTQPTTSSSPGSPTSGGPVARLQVKVDDGTSRDVLASMSDVAVDASNSTGAGALTFSIDFGDGTVATSSSAHHTYATAGMFTIAATVTDTQGRKATDSSAVTVKAVTGRWFQAGYAKRSNRVEVRQLSIDSQDGLNVRGIYRTTGDADRAFTGTLTPPRKIEIASSGGTGLLGLLPDRLSDEATPWTLIAQGADVDGERLDFHAIVGDPVDAPPVASLTVRFDGIVFGRPIAELTPITFDGTASRGSALTSFIEFGDGTFLLDTHATRVIGDTCGWPSCEATARLTVVDRFGRSATASARYITFSLEAGVTRAYWMAQDVSFGLAFSTQNGVSYTGTAWGCYVAPPTPCGSFAGTAATATTSGIRDIVVTVPDRNLVWRGTIGSGGDLTLTDQSGRTLRLQYRTEY